MRSARSLLRDAVVSGTVAGLASALAAAICAKIERRPPAAPMNAVSHIIWGGDPARHARNTSRNAPVGFALHQGSAIWWALFFERLFGKRARGNFPQGLMGAAAVALLAYVVDYHVVPKRLQPGFEKTLSDRSLFSVYASLAGGFALTAWLRGFEHHQVKDRDKSEKCRHA